MSNDDPMKAFTPEDQDQSDKPVQHQGENPKVLYIPVEPTGEAMKHAIKTDPGSRTVEEIQQAELEHLETIYEDSIEIKRAFDLVRVDGDIDRCLSPAVRTFIDCMASGKFTPAGAFIMAMRKLVNSHRVFRTYLPYPQGTWPRDSKVVEAEIENEMPEALECLREELEAAMGVEAFEAKSGKTGD